MSTQIQPSKLLLERDLSEGNDFDSPWAEDSPGYSAVRLDRFVAYPDGRYFASDCRGGKWFGEGTGRCKLWPWLVAE